MSEELKRCPFCGGEAVVSEIPCSEEQINTYIAICKNCGAETAELYPAHKAVSAWNTRTITATAAETDSLYKKMMKLHDEMNDGTMHAKCAESDYWSRYWYGAFSKIISGQQESIRQLESELDAEKQRLADLGHDDVVFEN